MNEANYASLEASKRLVEAGIAVETDCYWWIGPHTKKLIDYKPSESELSQYVNGVNIYPAPSMAEVWRELPEDTIIGKDKTYTGSFIIGKTIHDHRSTNPTDALIDLLIWLKQEAEHE